VSGRQTSLSLCSANHAPINSDPSPPADFFGSAKRDSIRKIDLVLNQSHLQTRKQRHDRKLTKKVALITGASAGSGQACARSLVQEGARLVLTARRQERLDQFETNWLEDDRDSNADRGRIAGLTAATGEVNHRFQRLEKGRRLGLVIRAFNPEHDWQAPSRLRANCQTYTSYLRQLYWGS
jgi:hypothetical protein